MFQPESYTVTLLFMIVSMLGWGSWANTMKLTQGWPFQAFYWDYVWGVLAGSLFWGLTLGSLHGGPNAYLANLMHADAHHVWLALLAGAVFNIANILLVAAIEIAGLAVAFPIGIGIALVLGVVLSFLSLPSGHGILLLVGVSLVVTAILLDALAYRRRAGVVAAVQMRGILLSVAAGLLMGIFYPLVVRAIHGTGSLTPYSVTFWFALGVAVCTVPLNLFVMRRPLTGTAPVLMSVYTRAPGSWHLWAGLGGAIWCTGAVFSFVASSSILVGPAISYALGQGATLISAAWGVFVWKEFADAPASARRVIPWMFLFFCAGLTIIAIAPLVHTR